MHVHIREATQSSSAFTKRPWALRKFCRKIHPLFTLQLVAL